MEYKFKGQVISSVNDMYIIKKVDNLFLILESTSELDINEILYLDDDTLGHVEFITESYGKDLELDGTIQYEGLTSFEECREKLLSNA